MILLLVVGPASADQTTFELDRGPEAASFRYGWTDGNQRAHTVAFTLPSAAVAADEAFAARPVHADMPAEIAAMVRERTAGKVPGVEITVTLQGRDVALGVAGSGDVSAGLAFAEQVHEEATDEWLEAHAHTRFGPGRFAWDLPRLAAQYADDVAPVAVALASGAANEREFVERALSFVQSIPYELLRSDGSGYRPPLAVLSANSGDCDSKGVLFLALVRAWAPKVPLAVVHVPDHVLVGVGLKAKKGERGFSAARERYVYAEPVGPGPYLFGQVAPENLGPAADGLVRIVP